MNTDIISILYVIPFLVYSAYLDIRTREVPNKIWSWMFVLALPLIAYNIITMGSGDRIIFLATVSGAIASCGILLYIGYFAGADFKCLVLLSVIIPVHIMFVLWLSVVISLGVTAVDMISRWSTTARKQPYLVNVMFSTVIALLLNTT